MKNNFPEYLVSVVTVFISSRAVFKFNPPFMGTILFYHQNIQKYIY